MSLSRAEAKKIKALHTKKGRRSAGRFLAEGVRLLEEAQRLGARPEQVYWAESRITERGAALVDSFQSANVTLTRVSVSELDRLTETEAAQGMVAVFITPNIKAGELALLPQRNVLLCENISDPGNLGTLIRSAAAFDFDPVVLLGKCAEPFSPKVVRASAGAVFGVAIAEATDGQIIARIQKGDHTLMAASIEGNDDIEKVLRGQTGQPVMLAIGSEAEGLSDWITGAADKLVRIPHTDKVESLNAAIAGSILMKACYDRRTQR